MALVVVPKKNYLTTCTKPYLLHTEHSALVEYDKLVSIMAAGRTTLSRPDIAGCLELFFEELGKLVADGKYVKTKLGSFYLTASGMLDSADQPFTPGLGDGSHNLRLRFRPERGFEEQIIAMTEVERGARFDRSLPMISSASSVKSESSMSSEPGDFLRITGERLKFDKSKPEEGLFFVNGTETRAVQYATILPSLVIAQVPPALAAGSYILAVRSTQGGKELHEGRAERLFVVE